MPLSCCMLWNLIYNYLLCIHCRRRIGRLNAMERFDIHLYSYISTKYLDLLYKSHINMSMMPRNRSRVYRLWVALYEFELYNISIYPLLKTQFDEPHSVSTRKKTQTQRLNTSNSSIKKIPPSISSKWSR